MVTTAPASAYVVEPVVGQNITAVSEHATRGGAVQVPGVDCGPRCANWWVQEHRPISGQASSAQLHDELRTLRSRGLRVLPGLGALGAATLAHGAFELGWMIGEGINAKYLGFNIPPKPTGIDSAELTPFDRGSLMVSGCIGRCYENVHYRFDAETDLFALRLNNDIASTEYEPDTWTESDRYSCDRPDRALWGVPWPDGYEIYRRPETGFYNFCFRDPDHASGLETAGIKQVRYLRADQVQSGPIEDYTDQPYERQITRWQGEPHTQAEVEQRARNALESGEYPMADAWYAHQLDPQTYDDPTDDEEHVDDCDPEDSVRGGDPGAERGSGDFEQNPDQWRARYEIVPESSFPVGSAFPAIGLPAVGGSAYMRWGSTEPSVKPWVRWAGWGYRKIRAKHGWGPTARELTRKALLTTPTRKGKYDEYSSLYSDRYPSRRGGQLCEWFVAVQRDPFEESRKPELSQQAPMNGIITAYGRYPKAG